jgi:hypothetical protein
LVNCRKSNAAPISPSYEQVYVHDWFPHFNTKSFVIRVFKLLLNNAWICPFWQDPLQGDIRNGFCSTHHTIQRCLFLLLYYSVCVSVVGRTGPVKQWHIIHLLPD